MGLDNGVVIFLEKKVLFLNATHQVSTLLDNGVTYIQYTESFVPGRMVRTKDYVYSCLWFGNTYGRELYKISSSGVELVKDQWPGSNNGCDEYSHIGVINYENNKIYYSGMVPPVGYATVFHSDGTSSGTYPLIAPVNGYPSPGNPNQFLPYITNTGNLLFNAYVGSGAHWEPFIVQSPFLQNSAVLFDNMNGNTYMGAPYILGEVNGKIVALAYNPGYTTLSIVVSDGSSTFQPILSNSVAVGLYGQVLQQMKRKSYGQTVGSKLYFIFNNRWLYSTDGITVTLVKDYSLW